MPSKLGSGKVEPLIFDEIPEMDDYYDDGGILEEEEEEEISSNNRSNNEFDGEEEDYVEGEEDDNEGGEHSHKFSEISKSIDGDNSLNDDTNNKSVSEGPVAKRLVNNPSLSSSSSSSDKTKLLFKPKLRNKMKAIGKISTHGKLF